MTPVWFAPVGLDRLYWASWPGSRHSLLIEQRPDVALTVFDSSAVPNEGAAFYATAQARRCSEEQLDEGLQVFNRRAVGHGIGRFTRERLSGQARLRLYVAAFTDSWVLDQDADVDQRVPVPLRAESWRPDEVSVLRTVLVRPRPQLKSDIAAAA